jgi:hypothetical protein
MEVHDLHMPAGMDQDSWMAVTMLLLKLLIIKDGTDHLIHHEQGKVT